MRKLTPAPSFKSKNAQAYIDQLCKNTFKDEKQAIWARVYFYRTRLNLTPQKVAQMLDIDELMVNSIAKDFGRAKTAVIAKIDANLNAWIPRESLCFYRDHLNVIQKRIKKSVSLT